jgi:hypothetical protein
MIFVNAKVVRVVAQVILAVVKPIRVTARMNLADARMIHALTKS